MSAGGLAALEATLRHDLALLRYPAREWLEARTTSAGEAVLDVAIVGGGQSGSVAAAALRMEKVTRVQVFDENPPDRAGPWLSFARMHTLRTPKHLTGPDLGIPSLTIQAWFEAREGPASWQEVGLIRKEVWAEYLAWYRRVLEIPVRCDTRVGAVRWLGDERCFALPLSDGSTALARRVVFATGIDGSGVWHRPPAFARLPGHLWAHTRDDIDFARLRGKKIAVLGAGASAFDNASVALEQGAAEVHLYLRRRELPRVNAYRWAEFVGFLKHVGDLPDELRWRFALEILRMGQLPPADTYARATKHPTFHMHPGSPWLGVEAVGDRVRLSFPQGTVDVDFVIVATGFMTDLSTRPELADIVPHAALWQDRYRPPPGEENEDLGRHPYLGPTFEFTERTPGAAPWLQYACNYTFGGFASLGFGGASISGMKYSAPRLVAGITRSLFAEDAGRHLASLRAWNEVEF